MPGCISVICIYQCSCVTLVVGGFVVFGCMFVLLSGLQAPQLLFQYSIIQQPKINTGTKAAYFDAVTLPAEHC